MGNKTVCEAIAASAEERDRLQAGRPAWSEPFSAVSAFLEPGTCSELQDGTCWESREGNATYSWDGQGRQGSSWCSIQALWGMTRLQWSITYPQPWEEDFEVEVEVPEPE